MKRSWIGALLGARRGGQIPGAVNIDWREHLRPDGTFKPVDELRRMYVAKAVTPDKWGNRDDLPIAQ